MATEPRRADSHRVANLIEKFRNRSYRHSYVAGHTRRSLARQMRKFRGNLSQEEFGDILEKRQTVVSRLEDPNYGKMTLQTLFEVAEKLDVAVFVRFVDFSTFIKLSNDLDESASCPVSYDSASLDELGKVRIRPDLVKRILEDQAISARQKTPERAQEDQIRKRLDERITKPVNQ